MNLEPPSSNSADAMLYTALLGSLIEIVRSISVSLFLKVFARILTGSDVSTGDSYLGVNCALGGEYVVGSGMIVGSTTLVERLNVAVAPSNFGFCAETGLTYSV